MVEWHVLNFQCHRFFMSSFPVSFLTTLDKGPTMIRCADVSESLQHEVEGKTAGRASNRRPKTDIFQRWSANTSIVQACQQRQFNMEYPSSKKKEKVNVFAKLFLSTKDDACWSIKMSFENHLSWGKKQTTSNKQNKRAAFQVAHSH